MQKVSQKCIKKLLKLNTNMKKFNYSIKMYGYRFLWSIARFIFLLIPNGCFGAKRILLRAFGARVGIGSKIYSSVKISFPCNLIVGKKTCIGKDVTLYNLEELKIGSNVTISQGAHLCGGSHEYRNTNSAALMPLIKAKICINDGVWICSEAFIGPNVEIGESAIIGARAVISKNIPPAVIVAGNPGKIIKERNA